MTAACDLPGLPYPSETVSIFATKNQSKCCRSTFLWPHLLISMYKLTYIKMLDKTKNVSILIYVLSFLTDKLYVPLAPWNNVRFERFQFAIRSSLATAPWQCGEAYADNPPLTQLNSGNISFLVFGSIAGRISKTARILAITSQALASAMKRPGQILCTLQRSTEIKSDVLQMLPPPESKNQRSWIFRPERVQMMYTSSICYWR